MPLKNTPKHYGHIARGLHWTSVTLVLLSVLFGTEIAALAEDEESSAALAKHSSFGLALLAVMLSRFAWRMKNHNPILSYTIAPWQKRSAMSLHWFLYALVVSQCLLGVAQLLADGSPISFFDWQLFHGSALAAPDVRERLNDVHARFAELIYITVAIHVTAATYHQIFGVVEENSKRNPE